MSIDKAIPAPKDDDVLKLRIIHALASAALKTGQTFDQFSATVEAAGVMSHSNGGQDCTDMQQDAEKLGISMSGFTGPEPSLRQLLEVLTRIDARLTRARGG